MKGKRNPAPSLAVERLMDERDDLVIKMSMERDAPAPNADKIEALSRQIAQLEGEISRAWRTERYK